MAGSGGRIALESQFFQQGNVTTRQISIYFPREKAMQYSQYVLVLGNIANVVIMFVDIAAFSFVIVKERVVQNQAILANVITDLSIRDLCGVRGNFHVGIVFHATAQQYCQREWQPARIWPGMGFRVLHETETRGHFARRQKYGELWQGCRMVTGRPFWYACRST